MIWIEEMLPKPDVIQLLSHATVFACPSIYEPLGIVNLEAMACETAVVASAIGGIVEVVVDGETGLLVPLDIAEGIARAARPRGVRAAGSPTGINALVARPGRAPRDGPRGPAAGRRGVRVARDRGADLAALPRALRCVGWYVRCPGGYRDRTGVDRGRWA